MSEPLYLDPATDAVRRLTAASLAPGTAVEPRLDIRCVACGSKLGYVVKTAHHGLGFASTWRTELPLGFEVHVNGRKLSRGEAIKHERTSTQVVRREGPPMDYTGRDGVIALLTLPPDMVQDYPALLVRCTEHGDAELDRLEVVERARDGGGVVWKVSVSMPFADYAYHDDVADWLPSAGTVHRSEERVWPRRSTIADGGRG